LKDFLLHFAKRYIAGTERADAVAVAKELNALDISATIDILGENVTDEREAEGSVAEYLALLDLIASEGVDSTVSLKLTHLGLDISEDLARVNTERVVERAAELGNSVRIDMEGSAYTEDTIDIFLAVHANHPNAGIAVQSYLIRSEKDVRFLIEKGASVRLVKGAYKEPPRVAFQKKSEVDENFSRLMKELMLKGAHPAIATHDERLINEAIGFAREKNIPSEGFDFEMLLGIKRTLQKRLASEGFNVRVYVPYGENWLPYTLRRLSERKENLFFVLKNIFD